VTTKEEARRKKTREKKKKKKKKKEKVGDVFLYISLFILLPVSYQFSSNYHHRRVI